MRNTWMCTCSKASPILMSGCWSNSSTISTFSLSTAIWMAVCPSIVVQFTLTGWSPRRQRSTVFLSPFSAASRKHRSSESMCWTRLRGSNGMASTTLLLRPLRQRPFKPCSIEDVMERLVGVPNEVSEIMVAVAEVLAVAAMVVLMLAEALLAPRSDDAEGRAGVSRREFLYFAAAVHFK